MPNRYAVTNGNWSSSATWDGGTLPTSADDVYSNGFTVTIDQNVNVLSIRSTSATGIVAGGQFLCSTGRTISATGTGFVAGVANQYLMTLSHSSGTVVIINGNIPTSALTTAYGILLTGLGGVTNYTGNIGSVGTGGRLILALGRESVLNITGNISGASCVGFDGRYMTGTVIGNITETSTVSAVSVGVGAKLTVTGNLSFTTGTAGSAIQMNSEGWPTATLTVIGSITAGTGTAAVTSSSTLPIFIGTGPFIAGTNGHMAVSWLGPRRLLLQNNSSQQFKTATGTATFQTTQVLGNQPAPSDTRKGITYGPNNGMVGIMEVPDRKTVEEGVPVDATTGTAIIYVNDSASVAASVVTTILNTVA